MASPTETSTSASLLLDTLVSTGITHLFANLGSDHPAFLEALARRKLAGDDSLKVITATNEFVGLSAAQGFYQVSGQMQAVLVHVDAGTLAMGGGIHNVARCRVPVLIMAGTSPVTDDGELVGSRNEFIHNIQDTVDQRSILRGYTVYDHEIRTGRNVKQIVLRACQVARSKAGPAYLIAGREVFEEHVPKYTVDATKWKPVGTGALRPDDVQEISQALRDAKQPVVITSYLGRNPEAAKDLQNLCEKHGIAVIDAVPFNLNVSRESFVYMGNQWSHGLQNSILETADVVLVMDCDVPWVKMSFKPHPDAKVYHIDRDVLKSQMSLFHIDTELSCEADTAIALGQIASALQDDITDRSTRINDLHNRHKDYKADIQSRIPTGLTAESANLNPNYVISVLNTYIKPSDILLTEAISNYRPVTDIITRTEPGTYFTAGGTSLGWHGGASIGASLANPSKTVITVVGDGTFMFSVPSSVHYMARKYEAPFLTVILNNRGWKSPVLSCLGVHPDGVVANEMKGLGGTDVNTAIDPPPDYAKMSVAAGAGFGAMVKTVGELGPAIEKALKVVREERRAAVLDVWLKAFEVGDVVG